MSFDRAFEIVVGLEGGYVNDPVDPGGETKYGITRRDHPAEDIANLTLDRAKEIYRVGYWNPVHGNDLPWPLSLCVFDAAVNQGVVPAAKMLQRALGVAADGIIGRQTLLAAARGGQWHVAKFMAIRAMRYQLTRNFERYGEGWLTRIFEVAMKGVES